jgi:hypothetical protein
MRGEFTDEEFPALISVANKLFAGGCNRSRGYDLETVERLNPDGFTWLPAVCQVKTSFISQIARSSVSVRCCFARERSTSELRAD